MASTLRCSTTEEIVSLKEPTLSLSPDTTPVKSQSETSRKQANAQGSRTQWRFTDNILAPLKVRDFRLLFSGQMISTIGDMFYTVALPWLMLTSGHTPQELGIVLAAYGVPRVATLPIGGILSDRLRPRRVMLLADIMRALLVGILVVLVIRDQTEVWQLCAVAVPLGGFTGLFLPAYYAMTPEILTDNTLQAGNALNTSSIQLAILVGSGLGGFIVSRLQPGAALIVDALTFVVSAITLALMRAGRGSVGPVAFPAADQRAAAQANVPEENAIFGPDTTFWHLLRTWRLLQVALLVVIFGNFLFNGMIEVALPTLAHDQFAAGANGYGLLLATFGAGSFLGGLVAGGLGRIRHRGILMLLLIMALACWYSFLPFVGGLSGAAFFIGSAGLTNGILTVIAFTTLQQQAPRHLLGRLMAVLMIATVGLYPFSVALAGIITTHFGPALLFPIGGAMMLGAALFGWLQPEVRAL